MVGDDVVFKIHHHNCVKWQPGTIVEKPGPVLYIVNMHSGSWQRCHLDQILRREVIIETSANTESIAFISNTNSKMYDDNAIEILPPAKDSVTSTNTSITAPPSNLETNSTFIASDTPQSFSFNSHYTTSNGKPPDWYF